MAQIDLGIDLKDYDDETSIDVNEARAMVRGRCGRVALDVIRRWCHPHLGWRPWPDGPVVVLPAVKISGSWRTMPAWVEAFERKREELGAQRAGRAPQAIKERSAAADHRRAEDYLDRTGVKAG